MRDGQIAEVIAAADHDPDSAAEALVAAANAAGGIDNITVVLFEIVTGEPAPPQEPDAEPEQLEPDDDTMEQALEEPEVVVAVPVQRHGAGPGGRWLALAAIVLTVVVAALVVWWSLTR